MGLRAVYPSNNGASTLEPGTQIDQQLEFAAQLRQILEAALNFGVP
jgi:hypothetical protein